MCWLPRSSKPACDTETKPQPASFCAIEKSLASDRTIARKTPEQLAEVGRGGCTAGWSQAHDYDDGHSKYKRPRHSLLK